MTNFSRCNKLLFLSTTFLSLRKIYHNNYFHGEQYNFLICM